MSPPPSARLGANGYGHGVHIGKRDFDANKPLLRDSSPDEEDSDDRSGRRLLDEDDDFFSDVVDGIVERDRRQLRRTLVKGFSFFCAVLNCLCAGSLSAYSLYGHLFQSRLRYTQLRVNLVSITAELAMYLHVPIFGLLCDRYSPPPLSLLSGILFGFGYLLAAFAYKSGPPVDAGGHGWPFWVMIVAFVGIGAGTSCMYLSALTTCAKNFGRGKYKGILLSVPIAAFGLSGMWQSQVGSNWLFERNLDGSKGDVDVHRLFLFLGFLLLAVGLLGTIGLRIVDEEELIDEAVEELERSGFLDESEFFSRSGSNSRNYGTLQRRQSGGTDRVSLSSSMREAAERKKEEEDEERRKKAWLLNQETRRFLRDKTMWWLAAGFFLVTGPGESFIINLGTIIPTLSPPAPGRPPAGSPSTHVTIVALSSTFARLLTGTLSDLLSPSSSNLHPHLSASQELPPHPSSLHQSNRRFTLSRITLLLICTVLAFLGLLLLATPIVQRNPYLFPITTAMLGTGYGATFALVPIIISVVWGVENFGTNWGVVATVPAIGAALWGLVYSACYQSASTGDGNCVGWSCYGAWAIGCDAAIGVAVGLWVIAWKGWKRRAIML